MPGLFFNAATRVTRAEVFRPPRSNLSLSGMRQRDQKGPEILAADTQRLTHGSECRSCPSTHSPCTQLSPRQQKSLAETPIGRLKKMLSWVAVRWPVLRLSLIHISEPTRLG